MKAIHKSKEWFAVWTGLFSYMIAMAETKENEVHDYSYLSKKGWADYLLEQGSQITWLESVINSMLFNFSADFERSGAFTHLSTQSSLQPSAKWFCDYNVPVWYPWGPEQARHPGFLEFAPPTDLLQASTTTIAKSPSQSEKKSSVQESKTETAKSSSQQPSVQESTTTVSESTSESEEQSSVQESMTTVAESMSQSEQQSSVQESMTTIAESQSQSEQRPSDVTTSQNAVASSIEETPVDGSNISQPNVVEMQAVALNISPKD